MKKHIHILLILLYTSIVFSQSPNSFKYQAVLRDASGNIKQNEAVSIKVSILQGSETGTEVFSETHNVSTNDYGLINLEIGTVNTTGIPSIDWASGPYFIKIKVDGNVMGTAQLLSVPYALYAEMAGNNQVSGDEETFNNWDKNIWDDVNTNGDQEISGYKEFTDSIYTHGIGVPYTFGADYNYVGDRGGYIGFGHGGYSEDFIGYKNNRFYFKDSPGGGDITDPDIIVGGNIGIGINEPLERLEVNGNINIYGNTLKNLADPINDMDAVNKRYLDSVLSEYQGCSLILAIAQGADLKILLRSGNYTVADLYMAGAYVSDLLEAGVSIAELISANADVQEMLDAGISLYELVAFSESTEDLLNAGITPEELINVNESVSDLLNAGVIIGNILGTTFDQDSNTFNYKGIGNQVWMTENLRTTNYNDGIGISFINNANDWYISLNTPKYCWPNDSIANGLIYGGLYSWQTIETGKLCPIGWHVPIDEEWKELEVSIGMSQSDADTIGLRGDNQGSKLAGDTMLWINDELEVDAEFGNSGFNAFPGGYRNIEGWFCAHINNCWINYSPKGYSGYWWTATEVGSSVAYYRAIYWDTKKVYRSSSLLKNSGLAVRCIKD